MIHGILQACSQAVRVEVDDGYCIAKVAILNAPSSVGIGNKWSNDMTEEKVKRLNSAAQVAKSVASEVDVGGGEVGRKLKKAVG